jgi:hypothetical protein
MARRNGSNIETNMYITIDYLSGIDIENYDCIICNYKARTQYSPETDGKRQTDKAIRIQIRYTHRVITQS